MGRCERLSPTRRSRTESYVVTLASERLFGRGQEDEVSVMAWRSFKLLRKIAGSNNGETQALAFSDESLWLARLAWSEMHGAPMRRWHLDETVRQVGGMLITNSRSIFAALTKSESPQLRVKRHVESRNNVPSPMLAFTGSTPRRCWQTV